MIKIYGTLDFNNNQVVNYIPENLASHPANPKIGRAYLNTTDGKYYMYNGTKWVDLSEELTASDILLLYKSMDGSGSGTDTDLFDGKDSSEFVMKGDPTYDYVKRVGDSMTGDLEFPDNKGTTYGTGKDAAIYYDGTKLVIDVSKVTASDLLLKCGAGKTLALNDVVYDDLPPSPFIMANTGGTAPILTAFKGNIKQYTFDAVNDEVHGSTELMHWCKEGEEVEIHLHWATNGVDTSNRYVKWEVEYSISNGKAAAPFDEAFGNSVVVSQEVMLPANTIDRAHIITKIADIPWATAKIGAYITWRARRIAASGTAPTNNPFGLAIGFHAKKDTLGSRLIYTK